MTTTTETAAARTCPPSAVADQILSWMDVKAGDLVLWDGQLVPVEWNELLPGHPDRRLVMLADDGPATIPAGTHAAVRRYTEGSGEDQALILAALDEAAEDRTYRAEESCSVCATAPGGMCPEHQEHLDRASEYRALRDELEAGR